MKSTADRPPEPNDDADNIHPDKWVEGQLKSLPTHELPAERRYDIARRVLNRERLAGAAASGGRAAEGRWIMPLWQAAAACIVAAILGWYAGVSGGSWRGNHSHPAVAPSPLVDAAVVERSSARGPDAPPVIAHRVRFNEGHFSGRARRGSCEIGSIAWRSMPPTQWE